ncbi:FAD-dependent oxidoreductase [Gaoshiqia sp. Z1-71]|uniref:FAD-dependent oxidoreductase n=1 Tax=Gaoshiqia hydrogeniformans TaxID=3290090 RepID=UPI003BF90629
MDKRKEIITIGGGVAGTEVSAMLAELGYKVTLIEKNSQTGGKLNNWSHLFPTGRPAGQVAEFLKNKIRCETFTTIYGTDISQVVQGNGSFLLKTTDKQQLPADAVIISTGFETFDASRKEEYGYSIYENVITSVDLEQRLKNGQAITTAAGLRPRRIAFIHCVGSRDEKCGNHHCSKVCCVTGVKQAMELAKQLPQTEIFCFYMDLRMFGLSWESMYREAQEKYNIQFIRGRLSEASDNPDETLQIKAEDTLSGRPIKMQVELLVLLVGMVPGKETSRMAGLFDLQREPNGFLQTEDPHLFKNRSSRKGIFLAGACTGPMTIDETLEHARSAAFDVHHYLQNE